MFYHSLKIVHVSFSYANINDWNEHKKKYGKTYSASEEHVRYSIFTANSKAIDAHNALYEKGLVSYKKGKNTLTAMTFAEVESAYMGAVNSTISKSIPLGRNSFKRQSPPSSRDWRQTPGRVGAIKNQGQCG